MAGSLEDVRRQVNGFLAAANSGLVSCDPVVGQQMADTLAEMAEEIVNMRERAMRLADVPSLGGHPESVIMRERQSRVAAGDPQSFEAYLTGLLESVRTAKRAVEASMRTIQATDEDAADGLGRQYE